MSISNLVNRVTYTGNGATTAFAVAFPFHAIADLVVVETTISTGAAVTKALTTHYTVSGTPDSLGHYPSGTVTAVTAPPSTVTWTIYRDPALTQSVDVTEGDPLPVESQIEAPLDKLTLIAQRVREIVDRTIRQPDGDSVTVSAIPGKESRKSKYLSFDSDGNPIATSVDPPGGSFLTLPGVLLLSDYASLSAAVAAIGGSTVTTLLISASSTVAVNTTVSSNITLWFTGAGVLTVDSGKTLTVNGPVSASRILTDVFTGSGTTTYGSQVINVPNINAAGRRVWSKGADVASATTVTLGTDGNYFDITGTTTITGINTLGIGTIVKLHFDGILTLTHHSANFVLPALGNIATVAGDEFEFIEYLSGKWRMLSSSATAFLRVANVFTESQSILKINPALTLDAISGSPTLNYADNGTAKAAWVYDIATDEMKLQDVDSAANRVFFDLSDGKMTAGIVPLARMATSIADSTEALTSNTNATINLTATGAVDTFYIYSVRGDGGNNAAIGSQVSTAETVDAEVHSFILRKTTGGGSDRLELVNGTSGTVTVTYKVYRFTET